MPSLLLTQFLLVLVAAVSGSSIGCKCGPSDPCWPSEASWSSLNSSVSGKLIKDTPPAIVCYPGRQEDLTACSVVLNSLTNSTYIANNPIALDYPINNTCPAVDYATGSVSGDCSLGSSPVYAVDARSQSDVIQAVNFARDHNVRFVVRNTGHDIIGRSTGYGSLEVWIRHLREGITFQEAYTASDHCIESGWSGRSFTIGGGYVWEDVYIEANKRNVIVVGGGTSSVGCIGGWAQGGGHSPASRNYGLGADQILEARVVLADGEVVTANACQNSDLFFAIRGGGGGTYGVVLSTTIKAYPETSVVAQVLQMAPHNDSQIPKFMEALAIIYTAYPDLDDRGYSGSAQEIFAPIAAQLEAFNGSSLFISTTYLTFSFYESYYKTLSDVQPSVGVSGALGSRFFGREALTSSSSTLKSMLNTTAGSPGQFTSSSICLFSGGQVFADARDPNSGVNPAWRTSYLHNIVSRGWAPGSNASVIQAVHDDITHTKVGAMRTLAPDTGSYMNEADRLDPLYLQDFYGGSLSKLEEVKSKYDPRSLFFCPTCVGSNLWHEDSVGRLCRND